jgi:putative ABC transport system substrate-binding protein
MRRRDLLLSAAAAVASKAAPAGPELRRIGFVQTGSRRENEGLLNAFRNELAALGWKDASNIAIVDRWADDQTERLPGIVKELIGSGVAVLVAGGTPATLAAKRMRVPVPIVFVGVDDPIALGVIRTMARPGGNATGLCLTSSDTIARRLELLQQLVPKLRRIAVIVRADPGLEQKLRDIRIIAERQKFQALILEAASGSALNLAYARLLVERCEAVYVASGPLGPAKRGQLIALAAEAQLPAIYSFRVFPIAGGLMSFGADYNDLFGRAAGYAGKILEGAEPADLPVEPPRKFDLTINLKTAGALGLEIPPAILAHADDIIQ